MSAFGNLSGTAMEHGEDMEAAVENFDYHLMEFRRRSLPALERRKHAVAVCIFWGEIQALWPHAKGYRTYYRVESNTTDAERREGETNEEISYETLIDVLTPLSHEAVKYLWRAGK